METIDTIELKDDKIYPDENVLQSVLKKAYESYKTLLGLFAENEMTYEWRYYRDGKAWLCKVQKKKRTIIWISAWNGFMKATIYFPEKYAEKIYDLDIGEELKEKIRQTKKAGKSTPCTFEIRDNKILSVFEKVMKLKIECK